MKITIKTLQQKQFQLDVEPEDTVLTVKEKIEETQKYAVPLQKLIFSERFPGSHGFEARQQNAASTSTSTPPPTTTAPLQNSPRAPTTIPQLPAVIQAPPSITSTTTSGQESTTSNPTATTQPITNVFDNASILVTGADYENAIQSIMELGYDRDQVVKAMRASFNNPDRAVEYLMTGFPESTQVEQTTASSDLTGSLPASSPANTRGLEELNFLRNQPQFQHLRQIVQQNPALLQPLLQQIGQSNPQLLQLINANQPMFMRLLQEGMDESSEGGLPLPPNFINTNFSREEKEAVDRLEALGFDRVLAIEAYIACDRNEELAANYLFEHNDEDDN
ncbi:6045_t:CDS:2 [Diversispora eburnea]|uniref:UV excision repair protein RAD23 n=1 Tax=Diversispora eburnea TaxID=1213867 RepID=A0A9N9APA1_9GLOM|nr:6045_t:CDS:2 [Diversispora eburnea]